MGSRTNLNFSYMGTKLLWAATTWDAHRYLDYFFFSDGQRYGRKWFGNELSPSLSEEWQHQRLIGQRDREEIEYQRNQTNRQYLDVNPEFHIYRDWDLDTVIRLEEQEKLEEAIMQALATPLSTWGEYL